MASTEDEECHSDPNFAVICSFLDRYGELLGLPEVSFTDLAQYLQDSKTVSPLLIELHIRLLRRIGKTSVKSEKWEKSIVNFCRYFSQVDAWELERFGYKHCCVKTKLKLLKNLLESQFDFNLKFKEKINEFSGEVMRFLPIGRDKNGLAYWYLMDKEYNIYVYREEQDDVDCETWQLVCKDRDELASLIATLQKDVSTEAEKVETSSESKTSTESSPLVCDGKEEESGLPPDPDKDSKVSDQPETSIKKEKAVKVKISNSSAAKDNVAFETDASCDKKSPVVKMEKIDVGLSTLALKQELAEEACKVAITVKTEPACDEEKCEVQDTSSVEKTQTPSGECSVEAVKEAESKSETSGAKVVEESSETAASQENSSVSRLKETADKNQAEPPRPCDSESKENSSQPVCNSTKKDQEEVEPEPERPCQEKEKYKDECSNRSQQGETKGEETVSDSKGDKSDSEPCSQAQDKEKSLDSPCESTLKSDVTAVSKQSLSSGSPKETSEDSKADREDGEHQKAGSESPKIQAEEDNTAQVITKSPESVQSENTGKSPQSTALPQDDNSGASSTRGAKEVETEKIPTNETPSASEPHLADCASTAEAKDEEVKPVVADNSSAIDLETKVEKPSEEKAENKKPSEAGDASAIVPEAKAEKASEKEAENVEPTETGDSSAVDPEPKSENSTEEKGKVLDPVGKEDKTAVDPEVKPEKASEEEAKTTEPTETGDSSAVALEAKVEISPKEKGEDEELAKTGDGCADNPETQDEKTSKKKVEDTEPSKTSDSSAVDSKTRDEKGSEKKVEDMEPLKTSDSSAVDAKTRDEKNSEKKVEDTEPSKIRDSSAVDAKKQDEKSSEKKDEDTEPSKTSISSAVDAETQDEKASEKKGEDTELSKTSDSSAVDAKTKVEKSSEEKGENSAEQTTLTQDGDPPGNLGKAVDSKEDAAAPVSGPETKDAAPEHSSEAETEAEAEEKDQCATLTKQSTQPEIKEVRSPEKECLDEKDKLIEAQKNLCRNKESSLSSDCLTSLRGDGAVHESAEARKGSVSSDKEESAHHSNCTDAAETSTVDKAVSEAVDKGVNEAVNKAVDKEVKEAVDKEVNEAVDKAVDKEVNEAVDKGVDKEVNEAVDKGVTEAVDKEVNEAVKKGVNEASAEQALSTAVDKTSSKGTDTPHKEDPKSITENGEGSAEVEESQDQKDSASATVAKELSGESPATKTAEPFPSAVAESCENGEDKQQGSVEETSAGAGPEEVMEVDEKEEEEVKPTANDDSIPGENGKDDHKKVSKRSVERARKRAAAPPPPSENLRRSSRTTHQPIRFKVEPETMPSKRKLRGMVSTPEKTPNGLSDKTEGETDRTPVTGDGAVGKTSASSTPAGKKAKGTKRAADQSLGHEEKQPSSKKPKQGNRQASALRKRGKASRRASVLEDTSSGSDSEDVPLNKVSRRRQTSKVKGGKGKPKSKTKRQTVDDASSMSEDNIPPLRGKMKRGKSVSDEDSDDLPLKKQSNAGHKRKAVKASKETSEEEDNGVGRRRSARVRSNLSKRRVPSPDSFSSEPTSSEMSFLSEEEDSDDEDFTPKGRNAQRQAARSSVQGKTRPIPEDDTPCCKCLKPDHPEWILLCDQCDAGYHTACLRPPLMIIPDGDWFCPPCEHKRLVQKLEENLSVLDGAMKKRERLIKRKERLAFVGISLDNILLDKRSKDGEEEPPFVKSKTLKDLDALPEELFTRRSCRSRRSISYQFKEFDDLIDNAIHDGVEAVEEAEEEEYTDPPRSGDKDIQTIVKAEREAEQGGKEVIQTIVKSDRGGKDIQTIIKAEREAERKAGKEKEVKEESSEEESEDGKPPPVSRRKNRRRLTALDDDDFEENNPDDDSEEYRASEDTDSEATIEEENFSEESEDDWRPSRVRYSSRPSRRSTRSRSRKSYDDDFVVNEGCSDDSITYRRSARTTRAAAKRRAAYKESLSEEEEEEEEDEETEVTENTSDLCSEDSDNTKKKKKKLTLKKPPVGDSDEQSSEPEVIRPSKPRNTKRSWHKSPSESETESSLQERPKQKGGSQRVNRKKMVLSDSEKSASSQSESEETEDEAPKVVKKRRILDSSEESAGEKTDNGEEDKTVDKEEQPSEDSKGKEATAEEKPGKEEKAEEKPDKEETDSVTKTAGSTGAETAPDNSNGEEGVKNAEVTNGAKRSEEEQPQPPYSDVQQPPAGDQSRGYHPQGAMYPCPEGQFSPSHPMPYQQPPYGFGAPPMYNPPSYRPEHFGGPYQPQVPYHSPPYSQTMGPVPHHGPRPQMSPTHRATPMSPSHHPSQMTPEGHSPHLSPTHHPPHMSPSAMSHPPYPGHPAAGHIRMYGSHPQHFPQGPVPMSPRSSGAQPLPIPPHSSGAQPLPIPPHSSGAQPLPIPPHSSGAQPLSIPPHSSGAQPLPIPPHSSGAQPLPIPPHSSGAQPLPIPPHSSGAQAPPAHHGPRGPNPMRGRFMIDNLLRQPSGGSFTGDVPMVPCHPYGMEPRPAYPEESFAGNRRYPQAKQDYPERPPGPPRQPYPQEGGGDDDDLSDVTDIVNYVMNDEYFKQNA